MATTFLGELLLRSADNSDQFHQHHVHAADFSNQVVIDRLQSPDYINGFLPDHIPVELNDLQQDDEMIPVDIEPGNETIKAVFRDAGNENSQYEVTVYLLIEEEEK